jgi:hypothetical protein
MRAVVHPELLKTLMFSEMLAKRESVCIIQFVHLPGEHTGHEG